MVSHRGLWLKGLTLEDYRGNIQASLALADALVVLQAELDDQDIFLEALAQVIYGQAPVDYTKIAIDLAVDERTLRLERVRDDSRTERLTLVDPDQGQDLSFSSLKNQSAAIRAFCPDDPDQWRKDNLLSLSSSLKFAHINLINRFKSLPVLFDQDLLDLSEQRFTARFAPDAGTEKSAAPDLLMRLGQSLRQRELLVNQITNQEQKHDQRELLAKRLADKQEELVAIEDQLAGLKSQEQLHLQLNKIQIYENLQRLAIELRGAEDNLESRNKAQGGKAVTAKSLTEISEVRQYWKRCGHELDLTLDQRKQKEDKLLELEKEIQDQVAAYQKEKQKMTRFLLDQQEKQVRNKLWRPALNRQMLSWAAGLELIVFALGLALKATSPGLSALAFVLFVALPILAIFYLRYAEKKYRVNLNRSRKQKLQLDFLRKKVENKLAEQAWQIDELKGKLQDGQRELALADEMIAYAQEQYSSAQRKFRLVIGPYAGRQEDLQDLDKLAQNLQERAISSQRDENLIRTLRDKIKSILAGRDEAVLEQEYLEAQEWLKDNQAETGTFPSMTEDYLHSRSYLVDQAHRKIEEEIANLQSALESQGEAGLAQITQGRPEFAGELADLDKKIKDLTADYLADQAFVQLKSKLSDKQGPLFLQDFANVLELTDCGEGFLRFCSRVNQTGQVIILSRTGYLADRLKAASLSGQGIRFLAIRRQERTATEGS